MSGTRRPIRLLDGLSEFVLTYEDKDGDLMLVGDVPWEYVLSLHCLIPLPFITSVFPSCHKKGNLLV